MANLRRNSGSHFPDGAEAIERLHCDIGPLRNWIGQVHGNDWRRLGQAVALHHAFAEAFKKFLGQIERHLFRADDDQARRT